MYFLFTDETNKEPSEKARFFIYGGVFIPIGRMKELHDLVEGIRQKAGYKPKDELKFAPSSKPDPVSKDSFTKAKGDLLVGCSKLGIKFSAYLVHHHIARRREISDLVKWGANTIISVFDQFLEEEKTFGVCILDRLPFEGDYAYLKEKFQIGLIFQGGRTQRLYRILAYAASCEGATHAISAIDIILGSFRYCVNEKEKDIVPKKMFPIIASMMWHRKIGETLYLRERGLVFRPKKFDVPEYKSSYDELTERFKTLLGANGK
jgi:hypothetical protein